MKFILNELYLRFPKLSIYIQPLPRSIKCQLNIMEYSPSEYTARALNFFLILRVNQYLMHESFIL